MALMLLNYLQEAEGEWKRVISQFPPEYPWDTFFRKDVNAQVSLLTHAIANRSVWDERTGSPSSLGYSYIKSAWNHTDPQLIEDQLKTEYPDIQWDDFLAIQGVIEDESVTTYDELYLRLVEVLPQYTDVSGSALRLFSVASSSQSGAADSVPDEDLADSPDEDLAGSKGSSSPL